MDIMSTKLGDLLNKKKKVQQKIDNLNNKLLNLDSDIDDICNVLNIQIVKCDICNGIGEFDDRGGYGGAEIVTCYCHECNGIGYKIKK